MDELPRIEIDPETFLREHCTLPALPQVLMRIQEVVHSEDVSVGEIAKIIGTDPSMSAQVLKVVNSSYYSLPREIVDIKLAVAYLGISEIYRIVLSMGVINTMAVGKQEEFHAIWFHSIYTALCSRHLVKRFEPLLGADELWVAALLHDVGKLVYLKFFPDHYKVLRAHCREQGCLFSEAERHFDLPSSAYLGTLLCNHWRLPVTIKQACAYHSLKELPRLTKNSEKVTLIRVITLANLLAVLSVEPLCEDKRLEIGAAVREILELKEEQFLMLMVEISELRQEAEQLV